MALAFIDESGEGEDSEGLRSRAPRLINAAAIGLYELDRAYRRYVLGEGSASGGSIMGGDTGFPGALCPASGLDDDLPLCDRLAAACAYYVAAMLIRGDNPAAADRFQAEYGSAVADVAAALPAVVGPIRDCYA